MAVKKASSDPSDTRQLAETRRVMGVLARTPPKPHDQMKVGRKPPAKAEKPAKPRGKGKRR